MLRETKSNHSTDEFSIEDNIELCKRQLETKTEISSPDNQNKKIKKTGSIRKKSKRPFISLPLEEYDSFSKNVEEADGAPNQLPSKIFYKGEYHDLNNLYCNELFKCKSVGKFLSSFDSSGTLSFVGYKNRNEPINMFNFDSTEASIGVFNKDLDLIETLTFDYGEAVQIMTNETENNSCKCIVLFNNGYLCSFDYKEKMENFEILVSDSKIIMFDWKEGKVIFTDGFKIYKLENRVVSSTEYYSYLITNLKLISFDGVSYIAFLDINGLFNCGNIDLKDFKTYSNRFGYEDFVFEGDRGLALIRDGFSGEIKKTSIFKDPKLKSKKVHFIKDKTGSVIAIRGNANRVEYIKLIQVISRGDTTFVITNKNDLKLFDANRLYILSCKAFNMTFMFATENGLIFKVKYAQKTTIREMKEAKKQNKKL